MSNLKVIGHINPDTDSTVSPIVYAWFLNEYKQISAKPYLSGEPNKEALYVLNKFQFEKPEILTSFNEDDKLVLIDTNNLDELLIGADKAEIVEIVDHHKLFGNIFTSSPIKVTIKPLASVATVIYELIKNENVTISQNIAGLLLAAIISDTLKFTSPTTTEVDIQIAKELSTISNTNIDELSSEMFSAKSDLTGMSIDDILHVDSKIFEINSQKIRISVLETTKPENALLVVDELISRMNQLKQEENLTGILFYVVDILNTSSKVVLASQFERNLVVKAHSVSYDASVKFINLPGVVSRKKQIVPNIERALG